MKKRTSLLIAPILALSLVTPAMAEEETGAQPDGKEQISWVIAKHDKEKGNKGKGKDKDEDEDVDRDNDDLDGDDEDHDGGDDRDTGEEPSDSNGNQPGHGKNKAVKEAVKLKKELIDLRQKLKHAAEVTEELQAEYEALVAELEKVTALQQAIEVQKELLERTFQKGDRKAFKKLGELYQKAGDKSLKTFVNGEEPQFDEPPFVHHGRAMVPVRAIGAALKADVKWEAETRSVVVTRGETTVTLYLDKQEAIVNGQTVHLETAPVIRNGRLFLPLRFISEQLRAKVEWQPEGNIIIIEDEAPADEEQPTGTEQPTETEQPGETEQPAETDQPTETEQPSDGEQTDADTAQETP